MTPEATPTDAVHIIGRMAGCVDTAGVLAVDECRTVCRASCCVKDKTGLIRRGPVAFILGFRSMRLAESNVAWFSSDAALLHEAYIFWLE